MVIKNKTFFIFIYKSKEANAVAYRHGHTILVRVGQISSILAQKWICYAVNCTTTQWDEECENCSFVSPRYILSILLYLSGYNS